MTIGEITVRKCPKCGQDFRAPGVRWIDARLRCCSVCFMPLEIGDRIQALTDVVEQSVVLYGKLHEEAIADGDVQSENFWEGHIATALHALGKLDEAHAVVDAAIGPVRTAEPSSQAQETKK